MKRPIALLAVCLAALWAPAGAQAAFGLHDLEFSLTDAAGEPETRAGAHPDAATTSFDLNTTTRDSIEVIDGSLRDLHIGLPAGFAGNAAAMDTCEMADFLNQLSVGRATACPNRTVLGYIDARVGGGLGIFANEIDPLYNLEPDPGSAAKLGAFVGGEPQLIEVRLNPDPPHNLIVSVTDTTQVAEVSGSDAVVWGNPASPSHDKERGPCAVTDGDSNEDPFDDDACEAGVPEFAYLTAPRSCTGPLLTLFEALAWWSGNPEDPDPVPAEFSDTATSPAMADCAALGFGPAVSAAPSTDAASSPSGFEFGIEIEDPELTDPDPAKRADSDLKKAVVTLPEGMTVNPAAAGGLDACSRSELDRESAGSRFGSGCPAASRVAEVEVTTPLLEERVSGSIFLAEPFRNPLGELLVGYLVLKQPERGVVVKLAGAVEADPESGRIVASFDQNPQFPFSDLEVSFFGGARGPLSTPAACGDYRVRTALHPWSGNPPDVSSQTFELDRSPGAWRCPRSDSRVPLLPAMSAGAQLPIAAAHSPFLIDLSRPDGSQRFSAVTLNPPPGLTAKLAVTPPCPEAALAHAARRDGKDEQARPSCPAASRLGPVHAAVGSGPDPYWTRGTAYLAGPYKGGPLSIAILAPAVAGPFDLGVVVIRTAVRVDPRTAQITAVSDPIPEFLQGIPLDVRRAVIAIDKPQFVLNGTSCNPTVLTGLLTSTQGLVAPLSNRFQLAECRRLGFKPRVSLRLFGGIKRTKYQGLRAVVRPRPGDANISRTVVRFPRSAFVAQEHIRTICTRVQFAADACPKGSVYGRAIAYSPLLGYPLKGAVFLRSSDNELPDAVADLRGPPWQPIRVELVIRNDSVRGALRNSVEVVPDAPVSYFRLNLFGGKKGLIVNSRNICRGPNKAVVAMRAHNGRRALLRPNAFNPKCKKARPKRSKR